MALIAVDSANSPPRPIPASRRGRLHARRPAPS